MARNPQNISQRHVDIEEVLRKYTPQLRKNVDPKDIYPNLIKLTRSDTEQIECQMKAEGNMRGMDKLLECIVKRPKKCFFDFLVILEKTGYAEKSQLVIKGENLINTKELLEAKQEWLRKNEQPDSTAFSDDRPNYCPNVEGAFDTPARYPPIGPNQWSPVALDNFGRDQRIGSSVSSPLHYRLKVPSALGRVEQSFPENDHHSSIGGGHGQNMSHCNLDNFGHEGRNMPSSENDSIKKGKDCFSIDVTPLFQRCPGQSRSRQADSCDGQDGTAAVSTSLREPVSISPFHLIQSHQSVGQQNVGTVEMDNNQQEQSLYHIPNTPEIQSGQPVPLRFQEVPLQDHQAVENLPDKIHNKLASVLCDGSETPLWRKVGQKNNFTRKDTKCIERSKNPGEALLDFLNDKCAMTIGELRHTLQEIGCYEALRILDGTDELQQNIQVSDEENIKMNNLGHLGGRASHCDETSSCDFNMSPKNTESFIEKEKPNKVMENVSVQREPMEHGKCESYPESLSSMSDSCSKSMTSNKFDTLKVVSDCEGKNQVETVVDPVEAETNQEKKCPESNVVCFSEDICAALRVENAVDNSIPATATGIPNKTENQEGVTTEENLLREEIQTDVSVVQAQGDANYSQSEKPLDQELFHQEIQTQPNISSFHDLQHHIPDHHHEELSTATGQSQNIIRATIQQNPELEAQEMSENDNDNATGGHSVANISDKSISPVKAEGDQNLKQSALPLDLDRQKFQRDVEQAFLGASNTVYSGGPQGERNSGGPQGETSSGGIPVESDSLLHRDSFRDVQNSVPEYRTEDLENPDSSLAESLNSVVIDEDETFLKERNRCLP